MNCELVINTVGVVAVLCSMASFLPQVAKIERERDASSVSLKMYVVTVSGFSRAGVHQREV
jgi:MtN3 and saliva related transmembrane protein